MLKDFLAMQPKDKWDVIFKFIGLFSLIIAGISLYDANSKDSKLRLSDMQKQSFSLYSTYSNPNLLEDRRIIGQIRLIAMAAATEQVKGIHSLDEAENKIRKIVTSVVRDQIINQNQGESARSLVNFFDQAYECVNAGLCERSSIYRLLHEEAYQMSYILSELISEMQLTQPKIGLGLKYLAGEQDPDHLLTRCAAEPTSQSQSSKAL